MALRASVDESIDSLHGSPFGPSLPDKAVGSEEAGLAGEGPVAACEVNNRLKTGDLAAKMNRWQGTS